MVRLLVARFCVQYWEGEDWWTPGACGKASDMLYLCREMRKIGHRCRVRPYVEGVSF